MWELPISPATRLPTRSWPPTSFTSASRYQVWAIGKGLTPGVNFADLLDADGDGRLNVQEFLEDGNPLLSGEPAKRLFHGRRLARWQIWGTDHRQAGLGDLLGLRALDGPWGIYGSDSLSRYDNIESSPDLVAFGNDVPIGSELSIVEDPTVVTPPGMPPLSPGWSYRHFRFTAPVSVLPAAFIRTGLVAD